MAGFSNGGPPMTERLEAVTFSGPAGVLEGLWKERDGPRIGSAVFAHPHPLHGGTLHSKVVHAAARALSAAGYGTLRFNFRGVGVSAGRHDGGRGETDDYRAAMDEALRRGGPPLLAGGFSFGAAVALRAIRGDERVQAYLGAGLPLASSSGQGLPPPAFPALFVVGEKDTFGPPSDLRAFVGDSGRIVEVPGTDHFFEGNLIELESAIGTFLRTLPVSS